MFFSLLFPDTFHFSGGDHEDLAVDESVPNGEPERPVSVEKQESVAPTPDEVKDDDEIDIDLGDPDVEKAATKIQAGFKGHRARKEVGNEKKDHKICFIFLREGTFSTLSWVMHTI